jgi:hypothetical protein
LIHITANYGKKSSMTFWNLSVIRRCSSRISTMDQLDYVLNSDRRMIGVSDKLQSQAAKAADIGQEIRHLMWRLPRGQRKRLQRIFEDIDWCAPQYNVGNILRRTFMSTMTEAETIQSTYGHSSTLGTIGSLVHRWAVVGDHMDIMNDACTMITAQLMQQVQSLQARGRVAANHCVGVSLVRQSGISADTWRCVAKCL